ncbi:vacuolar membrane-associated protein iml1, partial [Linderina pennispora]
MPSSLMQIRYTSLYPISYLSHQLYGHMHEKNYLDPNKPIALPPPAARRLNLGDSLNVESPTNTLAFVLQHHEVGLKLRNVRWHFTYYDNIFAGYQLVDWILVNFANVSTRAQAVEAGNRMMKRKLFQHAGERRVFEDGYHFYQFTNASLGARALGNPHLRGMQTSLMATIGFSEVVSKYTPGSTNASPTVSRPASRHGSNAPSVNNDYDVHTMSNIGSDAGAEHEAGAQGITHDMSIQNKALNKVKAEGIVGQTPAHSLGSESAMSETAQADHAGQSDGVAGETPRAQTHTRSFSAGYRVTPDMFPQLARKPTLRDLPKSMQQSRMFALDLDQTRKSTRIENCLVHLDAVQNPMTCFHLSINWLNCTNHLIDELVQGWARRAERCGMRLVEAPRAQDTLIEDNHPFHSPIRITLAAPPPRVETIFDDEWVSEFAFLADIEDPNDVSDDDYDEDPELDEQQIAKLRRRARIVRRMAQCLPKYAFERELLEEQDFILD